MVLNIIILGSLNTVLEDERLKQGRTFWVLMHFKIHWHTGTTETYTKD
jgi:hypothetical protein